MRGGELRLPDPILLSVAGFSLQAIGSGLSVIDSSCRALRGLYSIVGSVLGSEVGFGECWVGCAVVFDGRVSASSMLRS